MGSFEILLSILLWICAIGSGFVAGIFFAFSAFIMKAFARLPQACGTSAMQSINSTILRSLFMPLFFGTTLGSLLLTIMAAFRWSEPESPVVLAGGVIYVLGMFVCTIARNVPLNTALAAANPKSSDTASLWARYLEEWTLWNHARTVASAVACGLFIKAIASG